MQPAQRDRVRARHRRGAARGPLPRRADGRGRRRQGGARAAGPRPSRLGVQGAAGPGGRGSESGPAAGRGRHVQPGAGHRHGRGRPGGAGRVPAVGRLRPPAGRPGRASGRRGVPGCGLPQVPRRPRAGRGGHGADARGVHRVAARPRQPARRAGPAAGRDDVDGHLGRDRAAGLGPPVRLLRDPARVGVQRRAGHARGPLSLRRLRRAAPARRLGPGGADGHGPPGGAAAGRHVRRHDSRPGPLRCLPGRCRPEEGRRPGRGAGRGDGLRVPRRRCVHPRYDVLAHRGHHP